jgi:hypothetical protein
MLNKKIEILSLWIIIIILLFDEIKTFEINQINQTQKNKTLDKNINATNPINHNKKRKLETANYQPIRIYIDTYILYDSVFAVEGRFELFNKSLNRAKNALEQLIKVEREPNGIDAEDYKNIIQTKYGRSSFNSDIISENLLSNIDLAIFIRYSSDILNSNVCSEFIEILKTNSKGRPIIGSIVVDPNLYYKIVNNSTYLEEFFSYNFLHQFTHILGFNRTILNNTNKIQKTTVERINSAKPIYKEMIVGDKLMALVKKYFNCFENDFKGIEIEEKKAEAQSGCDNELIHWDARILLGDYMTAFPYIQDQVISQFTLALLEDLKFYEVNYYTGGLMRFGKNEGCRFFKEDCNEPLEIIHQDKFTKKIHFSK